MACCAELFESLPRAADSREALGSRNTHPERLDPKQPNFDEPNMKSGKSLDRGIEQAIRGVRGAQFPREHFESVSVPGAGKDTLLKVGVLGVE